MCVCVCVCVFISRREPGVSWQSLAIHLYHPSLLIGLLGCIQCQRRGDAYKFLLINQLKSVHKGISLMNLLLLLSSSNQQVFSSFLDNFWDVYIYLSIYLSACLSIYQSLYLSIYLSIFLWNVQLMALASMSTEYLCFNQRGDISTQNGSSLKLVDKFTYLGSNVSSTEKDSITWLAKAWTAIDRLSVILKSHLTDKKSSFFQAAVVSMLLYGRTTWTLTKRLEKKLDGNYTRMLVQFEQVLEVTHHKTTAVRPPTTYHENYKRRTRHAVHCWKS